MSGKLAFLLKHKVAVALLGAVLVGGGGGAAAMAASGGPIQLPLISQGQSTQHANDGSHANAQGDDHDGQQGDDQQNDGHEAEGKISSIDSGKSSFVVTTEHGTTITVVVNGQTAYAGSVHSFGDLKVGMSVEVKGDPQSDGSLAASGVYVESEHSGDSNDGQGVSGSNDGSSGSGTDDGSSGSGSGTDDGSGHDSTPTPSH